MKWLRKHKYLKKLRMSKSEWDAIPRQLREEKKLNRVDPEDKAPGIIITIQHLEERVSI